MRVTLAATIGFALLALSPGVARADDTPEFDVLPYATGLNKIADTELDFVFPKTGPAPAQVSITVPAGFALMPAPVGTTVADADVDVFLGGKTTTIKGKVVVDDPARYTTNACAPGTHTTVWVMFLTVAGQPYVIPIYVDASGPTQPPMLQLCLLSPDVPGTAGGAPGGARLTYIGLDFQDSFRNPPTAGAYLWSATVTPFTTGTGEASPTTTYELRAVESLPASLTTKARYDAKHNVTIISGRLARIGEVADIHVHIFASASLLGPYKEFAATYTDSHGAYTVRKKLTRTEWVASYVREYIGNCTGVSTAPAGCTLQSYSPVLGDLAHAVVSKPKPKR